MSDQSLDCLFFENPSNPLESSAIIRTAQGTEVILQAPFSQHIDHNHSLSSNSNALFFTNLDLLVLNDLLERSHDQGNEHSWSDLLGRLLPRSFFHHTAQDLLANFGAGRIDSRDTPLLLRSQRALVCKHFSLVHDCLVKHYDFSYPSGFPLEQRFCASQLILKSRYSNRSFDIPKKHSVELNAMYEERSICGSTRVRRSGKTYRFQAYKNMVEHLFLVSKKMIPFGVKLEEIDPNELGTNDKEIAKVLGLENRPFCAEVEVLQCEPDLGVLASLYNQQSNSFWISDVDLVWLNEVSTLRFKKILLSRSYVSPPANMLPPSKLFGDPLVRFSPVANTVAYIHLSALVGGTSAMGTLCTGLLSNWLKSIDKAQMLLYARIAKSLGFEVISFGLGHVDMLVHETQLPEFKEFLVRHCFQYPNIRALDENLDSYEFHPFEPVIVGDEVFL